MTGVNHDEPGAAGGDDNVAPHADFNRALEEASARRLGKKLPPPKPKHALKEVLVLGYPIIVKDIGKKKISFKAKFRAPPTPGRYTFTVKFKSTEFIGSDCEAKIGVKVLSEEEARAAEPESQGDDNSNSDGGDGDGDGDRGSKKDN